MSKTGGGEMRNWYRFVMGLLIFTGGFLIVIESDLHLVYSLFGMVFMLFGVFEVVVGSQKCPCKKFKPKQKGGKKK